jgi:hypothetical protein
MHVKNVRYFTFFLPAATDARACGRRLYERTSLVSRIIHWRDWHGVTRLPLAGLRSFPRVFARPRANS